MAKSKSIRAAAVAAFVFAAFITSSAAGQPPGANGRNKIDGVRFDVHAAFGWYWALGVGFRVDIPLVPDGFISALDDEFALTVGGDFQFLTWDNYRGGSCNGRYGCWGDWSLWPSVAAQWNFYLTPKWSVFPELGVSIPIYQCGNGDVCVTASPVVSFGARYHFAPPRVALLFRVSYPYGLQVGLNF